VTVSLSLYRSVILQILVAGPQKRNQTLMVLETQQPARLADRAAGVTQSLLDESTLDLFDFLPQGKVLP
jgi:hypothetical protein